MNKCAIVVTYSLLIASLHGMDQLDYKRDGVVSIGYESIYNFDEKVDVLIVGMKKQQDLSEQSGFRARAGDIKRVRDNKIFTQWEIGSVPYVQSKEMKSTVLVVGEPGEFSQCELQEEWLSDFRDIKKEFFGQQLATCYTNVLSQCAQDVLPDKHNRTIAISLFGESNVFSDEEVAPIAVKAIIDFLKNNPNSYALIHLLAKNDVMARLYKKLFFENAFVVERQ